jgi:NADH-quinone oxidoreductase subunit G
MQADNRVVFFGAEGLGLGGSARLANALAEMAAGHRNAGRPNNGLVAVHPHANDQGAWDQGFRPPTDLAAALLGANAAYLAASDPLGDGAIAASALDGLDCLIVQDLFLTETAARADIVLPAQAYVERDGSYTSGERRVQRFYSVVPEAPGTRPDFTITAQIAMRLGLELEGRIVPRAFANLTAATPAYEGLTFMRLAQVEEQFPIVGRGDMYYGGTTYENSQGLGVQLPLQESGAAGWQPPAVGKSAATGLTAVPITRLYDHGTLIAKSGTLAARLDQVHAVLHPEDAARLDLQDGARAAIILNGSPGTEVRLVIDASIPQGFVLVPRSMGIPLHRPAPVKVSALTEEVVA